MNKFNIGPLESLTEKSFTEEPFAGCCGENAFQPLKPRPFIVTKEQHDYHVSKKELEQRLNQVVIPISEQDFNKVITLVHSIKHPHVKYQSSELMTKEVADESIKKGTELFEILKKHITKNTKL